MAARCNVSTRSIATSIPSNRAPICSGNSAKIAGKLSTELTSFAPIFFCCRILILWDDSQQRKRDLPEKREQSKAARIGRETHFGKKRRGLNARPTSGNRDRDRERASDWATGDKLRTRQAHKICESDERRTSGCACGSQGGRGAEIDLVPKPDLRRFERRKGESSQGDSPDAFNGDTD